MTSQTINETECTQSDVSSLFQGLGPADTFTVVDLDLLVTGTDSLTVVYVQVNDSVEEEVCNHSNSHLNPFSCHLICIHRFSIVYSSIFGIPLPFMAYFILHFIPKNNKNNSKKPTALIHLFLYSYLIILLILLCWYFFLLILLY